MWRLLTGWWAAIWPNLAANIIWVTPALWIHHQRLRRHHRGDMAALVATLRGEDEEANR